MKIEDRVIKYNQLGIESENVIFKVNHTNNIRITIKQNLQVTVTIPDRRSLPEAKKFFESKINWAQYSLTHLKERQKVKRNKMSAIEKLTAEEFLVKRDYLINRCLKLADIYGFKIRKIIIRQQKTIWGSCSYRNDISLNARLAFLNKDLIDYVILHELVHTEIKDHSRKFWTRLEQILPSYRFLNRQLRDFIPSLIKIPKH